MSYMTQSEVRRRIESAGKTLALYPRGFGRPQGAKSTWPDTLPEKIIDVIKDEEGKHLGIEIIMPDVKRYKEMASLKEQTELDIVIDWIQDYALYCMERGIRVGCVNALWLGMRRKSNGEQQISWVRISEIIGCSDKTAKDWYEQGIDRIKAIQNEKRNPHNPQKLKKINSEKMRFRA